MRTVEQSPPLAATEIDGIETPSDGSPESRFRPELFGQVAQLVYGAKADAKMVAIAKRHGVLPKGSDRTGRFWLSGKVAAPACVAADMHFQITRRK